MKTLIQCIDGFIDNINVTDRQEEAITGSVDNLTDWLKKEESGLFVKDVFTNGSYERDTMIRPLDDVDLFAVLDFEKYKTELGTFPTPKSVLAKLKNYLDGIPDYKDKVSQDRPCITIELSKIDFDVLPSFEIAGIYYIPNWNLSGWIMTYPKTLTSELNAANTTSKGVLKKVVKAVKYWKRENKQSLYSFHVEEIAIAIFKIHSITKVKDGIEKWFEYAPLYLDSTKFKSADEFTKVKEKIQKIHAKLKDAKAKYDGNNEAEAIKIWKEIFDKEFDIVDDAEANEIKQNLTEGTLKIGNTGILSNTVGKSVPSSKGFYGENKK